MRAKKWLVVLSALFLMLTVSVSAEDAVVAPPTQGVTGEAEQVSELSVPDYEVTDVQPQQPSSNVQSDTGSGNALDDKTFTEIVIDTIYAYRADIISACGAVAFLIYSFLYKKKLVPSVDGLRDKVVTTMAGVVGDVQGYIEIFTGKLNTQQETWNKKINEIADIVKGFEGVMNETQRQQTEVLALRQELAASDTRNEIYGRIMRAQVEMIHQTLSSASLVEEQHMANHKAYLKQIEMLDALDEELAAKTGAVSEVIATEDEEQAGEAVMTDETVSG